MGSNNDALNTRVVGQRDREGDWGTRRAALLLKDMRDGVRRKGAAAVGLLQGGLECGSAGGMFETGEFTVSVNGGPGNVVA